jgi:hypothetical protein
MVVSAETVAHEATDVVYSLNPLLPILIFTHCITDYRCYITQDPNMVFLCQISITKISCSCFGVRKYTLPYTAYAHGCHMRQTIRVMKTMRLEYQSKSTVDSDLRGTVEEVQI